MQPDIFTSFTVRLGRSETDCLARFEGALAASPASSGSEDFKNSRVQQDTK